MSSGYQSTQESLTLGVDSNGTNAGDSQATKKRKRRTTFNAADDILILNEVIATSPFEDSERWKDIAATISTKHSKGFTDRNVRDRVDYLLKNYGAQVRRKSGTAEEYTARDQLLQQVKELKESSSNSQSTTNKAFIKAATTEGEALRDGAAVVLAERQDNLLATTFESVDVEVSGGADSLPEEPSQLTRMEPLLREMPIMYDSGDEECVPPAIKLRCTTSISATSSSSSSSGSPQFGGRGRWGARKGSKVHEEVDGYLKSKAQTQMIEAKARLVQQDLEREKFKVQAEKEFEIVRCMTAMNTQLLTRIEKLETKLEDVTSKYMEASYKCVELQAELDKLKK